MSTARKTARDERTDILVGRFAAFEERLGESTGSWFHALRRQALERVVELGFPTTRHEDWKYTNPSLLVERLSAEPAPDAAKVEQRLCASLQSCARVVLEDGRFDAGRSDLTGLPEGVRVQGLAEALGAPADPVRAELAHLGRIAPPDDAFTALNAAFVEDGVLVVVPDGVIVDRPIHVAVLSGAGAPACPPRILVVAGSTSQVSVVETFESAHGSATNAVTELALDASASIEHVRVVNESDDAQHVGLVAAKLARDARLASRSVLLGGGLVRVNARVALTEPGAECVLDGLYLGEGKQHRDHQVFVHHAVPHCRSEQVYKGVLSGAARGVFTGKVLVDEKAIKTEAHQVNRNLLLSETALADTRPQLEIYADDVRCTHGATIGRLDDEALFYLRSRGLPAEHAEALLVRAFATEVLDRVGAGDLRAELESLVSERVAGMVRGGAKEVVK